MKGKIFEPNPDNKYSQRLILSKDKRSENEFSIKEQLDSNLYGYPTFDIWIAHDGGKICIHHMISTKTARVMRVMCLGNESFSGPIDGVFRGRPF